MRFRLGAPFVKILPASCASLRGSHEIGVGYGANPPLTLQAPEQGSWFWSLDYARHARTEAHSI